ncbi:AraC family transcriptional regulator [Salipaludibacillus neizhouensis]|uniref:AraC family transcriptional regulator n=1 Tax=Salipaludibacillus neizhouensis TaxID=885475 RepID=A0A3A9K3V5_9BACI|nr:AraC family transcriptional regulator [Salipaludibacillus neizhouensis]RKL65560.1 AraC family transcriptional regulator [Salipaludibacillus neizhouensis]
MKHLFEQIDLKPFTWIYRRVSEKNFQGFYHWHQGCELLFVYRGQGRVIVNQQTYEIKKGMLFFFQPFQLHKVHVEVSSNTPYERSIIHFDPLTLAKNNSHLFTGLSALLKQLQNGINEPQAFDLENVYQYIYEVCEIFNKSLQTSNWEDDSQLFLLQLLSCIRSNIHDAKLDSSTNKKFRSLYYSERIMQWIEEHYMEPFDLELLSDELHLSKSYVSRIFKRETGSSLTEYLTIRRIKQACQLLHTTNKPIELIGESVGLGSVSYFIQIFKKNIGTTPHQYRLSHHTIHK